ncbi:MULTISPECIES: hypothetical protein [unclassified Duganella]|uniref:hypothetical protein n=1 Tax=unclassified Duganella TaxID=2636909 RepID=UPI000883B987|nr:MULTISPECIES: hypothetical protein [unclassified Duganella]SDH50946.1 hypothetical protein SAMN05216320_11491 [Duganella sp. OV458]SDK62688.1 hypothetical protein SAMN05428973_1148 [Duganella sp. OV510]
MEQYIVPFRSMLPPNARLLVQAGASNSELAQDYRALYPASCTLVVEADPAPAQQARDYAERVYLADLESAGDAFYKQLEWADGWYFDTTLEQFANPLQVLQQVRKVIQFDASITARIINRHYWDAPSVPPRHAWGINDMLVLFQQAGFRVDNGVLLNPGPLPPAIEDALRQQAASSGAAPQTLLDAAQPSHYLIKAVPA